MLNLRSLFGKQYNDSVISNLSHRMDKLNHVWLERLLDI